VLAAIAVGGTLRSALTAAPGALNESLMLVQVYLAVTAMSTLVIAAAVYERSQVERALRNTSAELREALTEIEAFSHAVSHDLRQSLATVVNFSAIIEQDHGHQLGSNSMEQLRRMRTSAKSGGDLLNELVKFAWAGDPKFPRRMLDMTALAREACAEVVVDTVDGSAVRFEVRELPPGLGNPQMLGRVLHNLLSNAVKFTRGREPRQVVISGRVEEHENVYCVTDNGEGFDPGLGNDVLKPFRHPDEKPKFAGTGLGLAIAAKIVRRHGGRMGAESDGATGARFWFTLPHGGER
jgi:signal transduction histidine kinase